MRLTFAFLLLASAPAFALEPADVWLVVNKNVPESRQVADHYVAKRGAQGRTEVQSGQRLIPVFIFVFHSSTGSTNRSRPWC